VRSLGEFQGASEAPVSIATLAEWGTRKFAQRTAARRVELKMVRRLRCVSVAGRKGHARSSRLGGGPFWTQPLESHTGYTTLRSNPPSYSRDRPIKADSWKFILAGSDVTRAKSFTAPWNRLFDHVASRIVSADHCIMWSGWKTPTLSRWRACLRDWRWKSAWPFL